MVKIAFLILDDIHHVHHLLPVALELSKRPEYECTVFLQAQSFSVMQKMTALYPGQRCRFQILSPSRWVKLLYKFRHRKISSARMIGCHISKFREFDGIVSPDSDTNKLIRKCTREGKTPVFIHSKHGAGDRPRKSFASLKKISLALLPGEKQRKMYIQTGLILPEKCVVTGYPKFDVIPSQLKPQIFSNNKPIILYNPHFVLELSSWRRWGLEILEYFFNQNDFNFIFAPHTNLFHRVLHPKTFPKKYFNAPQLIVDFGSEKSVDMTYTQAADIYLGDVSSQIYEFIRIARPCLFLNAQGIDWKNHPNYLHWTMGEVFDALPDLWKHLKNNPLLNPYTDIQKKLFQETYSITEESASLRSANAIHDHMKSIRECSK